MIWTSIRRKISYLVMEVSHGEQHYMLQIGKKLLICLMTGILVFCMVITVGLDYKNHVRSEDTNYNSMSTSHVDNEMEKNPHVDQSSLSDTDLSQSIGFQKLPESYTQKETNGNYINLLTETPPMYFPDYRNPCWAEPLQQTDGSFEGHSWWGKRIARNMNDSTSRLPSLFASRREAGITFKMRCLPYFYVAGVTKCGTSDLFDKILHHPMITATIKELHFWSRLRANVDGDNVLLPIKQYIDMFDLSAMEIENITTSSDQWTSGFHPIILGEGSPSYFWVNNRWENLTESVGPDGPKTHVANYIHHVTPMAKIIIIFREPVSRAYSHYWYMGTRSISVEDFHKRVVNNIRMIKSCLSQHTEWFCVNQKYNPEANLQTGMYVIFLEKWLEVFPREQLLLLRIDDYAKNTTGVLNQVFQFLEVGELPSTEIESWIELGIKNQHKPNPPIPEETKTILADFYEPYNQRLSRLLGDDKYMWTDKLK